MSWTKEQDKLLKDNLGKITYAEIAKKVNKSKRTVSYRVRQLGLSGINLSKSTAFKKKYSVNDNFFRTYNLKSCYYAGLLASDGYIHKNNNAVSITQSVVRFDELKKFKKDVDYSGVIYGPYTTKGEDTYTLTISSNQWQKDLENNFNIVSKKSLILEPPSIDDSKMAISYIIGLIDGDGSVGAYKYKGKKDDVYIITFCGTENIVSWVCNILNKYFPIGKRKIKYRHITENNTYFLNFSGKRVVKLCKYILENDIPFMSSKWSKVMDDISKKGIDYCLKDKRHYRERNENGRFCKIS